MTLTVVSRTSDLISLIAASNGGTPGTAGQNFLSHVTGAVATAAMDQYRIPDWEWGGPHAPGDGFIYNDNDTFTVNITFNNQGTKATNIKRTGNIVLIYADVGQPPGFDPTKITSSILSGTSGSSCGVKVRAPYSQNGSAAGGSWWRDYNAPFETGGDTQPAFDDVTSYPIKYSGYLNHPTGFSGHQVCVFIMEYKPDNGFFNGVFKEAISVDINNRDEGDDAFEYEWHTNSSYTNLFTTARTWSPGSTAPGESLTTYYLRARRIGAVSWTNVGAISWTDPR